MTDFDNIAEAKMFAQRLGGWAARTSRARLPIVASRRLLSSSDWEDKWVAATDGLRVSFWHHGRCIVDHEIDEPS